MATPVITKPPTVVKPTAAPKPVSAPKSSAVPMDQASKDARFVRDMDADKSLHDKGRLDHYVELKSKEANPTFGNADLERFYRQATGTTKANLAPKAPTAPTDNTVTNTAAPSPVAPTYNAPSPFQFNYNFMDYNTAKGQAEQQFNPLYEQAVKNIKAQQYQNEVASGEVAANRGIAQSGLAADALNKIKIASQGQIANADTERMSKVATLAQQMMERDQDRGDRLRGQAFSEYANNRDFGYGQFRDSVGDQQWQKSFDSNEKWKQQDQSNWREGFDFQKATESWNQNRTIERDKRSDFESDRGYNRGVLESDRGYNYQVGRDKKDDAKWEIETKNDQAWKTKNYNLDMSKFDWSKVVDQHNMSVEDQRLEISRQEKTAKAAEKANAPVKAKSGPQNKTDATSYWSDQKSALDYYGPEYMERAILNDPEKIKELSSQGYDINMFIDSMWNVATEGRFKNKAAYTKYKSEVVKNLPLSAAEKKKKEEENYNP